MMGPGMGMCMPGVGLKAAILLIALGIGYIVCYLAEREEKDLKTIGYAIGLFIIASSAFMIVKSMLFAGKMMAMGGHCMMKK